jgi:hypothetical protein
MKLTTNLIDSEKLELASIKAKRLCLKHECGLIDLIVLSIQVNADNKKLTNNKK